MELKFTMNSAQKLFDAFTQSTEPVIIIDIAHKIEKHFVNVFEKEPNDEIAEEFLYIIGAKQETVEWILLLIIIQLNSEGYREYFTILSNRKDSINTEQCKWAKLILKEIGHQIIDDIYKKHCNDLIVILDRVIESKSQREKENNLLKSNKRAPNDYLAKTLNKRETERKIKAKKEAKKWWVRHPFKRKVKCDRCDIVISRNDGCLTGPKWAYVKYEGSSREEEILFYKTISDKELASTPDMICNRCFDKYLGNPWCIAFSEWEKKQLQIKYEKNSDQSSGNKFQIIQINEYSAFYGGLAKNLETANPNTVDAKIIDIYCEKCNMKYTKGTLDNLLSTQMAADMGFRVVVGGATNEGNNLRSGKCPNCGHTKMKIAVRD